MLWESKSLTWTASFYILFLFFICESQITASIRSFRRNFKNPYLEWFPFFPLKLYVNLSESKRGQNSHTKTIFLNTELFWSRATIKQSSQTFYYCMYVALSTNTCLQFGLILSKTSKSSLWFAIWCLTCFLFYTKPWFELLLLFNMLVSDNKSTFSFSVLSSRRSWQKYLMKQMCPVTGQKQLRYWGRSTSFFHQQP